MNLFKLVHALLVHIDDEGKMNSFSNTFDEFSDDRYGDTAYIVRIWKDLNRGLDIPLDYVSGEPLYTDDELIEIIDDIELWILHYVHDGLKMLWWTRDGYTLRDINSDIAIHDRV